MVMAAQRKYPDELRERAVKMVSEIDSEPWHPERLPGALRRDRPPGRTLGAGASGRGGAERRRLDKY